MTANSMRREHGMFENQIKREHGRMIMTYIPVFKDKLAKLENRGFGHSEEARRLRNTIALAETRSSPSEEEGEPRFLVAAE